MITDTLLEMGDDKAAWKIEAKLFDSFIKIYKNKGYSDFAEAFTLAGKYLPTQAQNQLLEQVNTMHKRDIRSEEPKRVDRYKDRYKDINLRKEGAGVGTVATTGSGGLGFTPTHGGNGDPKGKKRKATIAELKEFLMLSKAEEHEYPMEEREDNSISDPPMVVEFPSAMDNTAVEAEQDFVMQVQQIQDHDKDRRSRESAMSDKVDPMADISKELDTIMKEQYYGVVPIQKVETRSSVLQKADELQKLGHEDALFKALNQTLEAKLIDLIVEKGEKSNNEDVI